MLNADVVKLKQCWGGQVYHSSFNVKSRGVAILIRRDVPFVTDNVISDINGRYIIVTGRLFDKQVVLINIYAPNFDDCSFFSKIFVAVSSVDNLLNLLYLYKIYVNSMG